MTESQSTDGIDLSIPSPEDTANITATPATYEESADVAENNKIAVGIGELARHRRFNVRSDSEKLRVHIELGDGMPVVTEIVNCSISGVLLRVISPGKYHWTNDLIIPASTLLAGEYRHKLGRLALKRYIEQADESTLLAFSTIDGRVPIGGYISKFLSVPDGGMRDELGMELSAERFTYADFVSSSEENIDILDRCDKFSVFFKSVVCSDKFTYYYPRSSQSGARIDIRRGTLQKERRLLMFGSNDYLGLSSNREVIAACNQATEKYGVGSTGTAPTSGTTVLHERLCNEIANMHGRQDALVFPSGYGTNLGIVAGLARSGDLIVADRISHASLHDGMKLSGATTRTFRHNDTSHLKKVLERERPRHAGCLILTEGMFSMSGVLGRLDEIMPIAREYDARVLVDQGHCFGILGENHTGTAEHLGVGTEIDISMGLFSKGLGTMGGFVTGSKALMDWYRAFARSHMFATSFPPGIAAATLKSLEIVRTGVLQQQLHRNIQHFVQGLIELGVPIGHSHISPIIPVHIGDEGRMGKICKFMHEHGVFALPVVYPVVGRRRCQFRFSLTALHTQSDIELTLSLLKEALSIAPRLHSLD